VQDFGSAARRHLADAQLLKQSVRLPNADHLAGFAAECALKEILIRFLGARSTCGKPVTMSSAGRRTAHGHLPMLWDEVKHLLAGRAGGNALAALLTHNPFSAWSVDDRYSDGRASTANAVATRLAAAQQMMGYLQNAAVQGVLS
jgi:hypothetical protein